jgi:hypothetical protein
MAEVPYLMKIKVNTDIQLLNKKNKNNKKISPLSGSELKYEPHKWNNPNIVNNHNCYSYAMGKIVKNLKDKAQPGYASGFDYLDNNMTCNNLRKRLLKDNPSSYTENFDNKCLPGFYKVFLALDIGNDYHWWRQDNNKYWSHKPGSTNISNIDGNKKKILDPLISSRKFSTRNYDKPCFYACVQSDLSRTLDEIYS